MQMARVEEKRGTYEYKRREVNNFDLILVKKKGGKIKGGKGKKEDERLLMSSLLTPSAA